MELHGPIPATDTALGREEESRLGEELLALYDASAPGLLRYAGLCTHEAGAAQEAVQQAFLDLLTLWRRGEQTANPREWLYRAVRQYFVTAGAQAALSEEVLLALRMMAREAGEPDFDAPKRQAEVRRKLIRIASPREFEILQLRAEGFSYEEIAGILEIHPGTVASTLSRALRKVRRAFREEYGG